MATIIPTIRERIERSSRLHALAYTEGRVKKKRLTREIRKLVFILIEACNNAGFFLKIHTEHGGLENG